VLAGILLASFCRQQTGLYAIHPPESYHPEEPVSLNPLSTKNEIGQIMWKGQTATIVLSSMFEAKLVLIGTKCARSFSLLANKMKK
jgi:hypothetical protein